MVTANDQNDIISFYNRLVTSNRDVNGRLTAKSKSGFKYVFNPGPIDKSFVLRISLPTTLKKYAGTKYGTVHNKDGKKIPLGLSFDKFDNLEQAADFLQLALADISTFTSFIRAGDGTRFYA